MMTSSNYGKENIFRRKATTEKTTSSSRISGLLNIFVMRKMPSLNLPSMFVSYNSTGNDMYYDVIAILHRIILTAMLTL